MLMFFSAFLGTDAGLPLWAEGVEQHARWLGLVPHVECRQITTGTIVSFCWIGRHPLAGNGLLHETPKCILASTLLPLTRGSAIDSRDDRRRNGNASHFRSCVQISVSIPAGKMCIAVPTAMPEQYYYAKTVHGYVSGNDMRLFRWLVETTLDERGVYALFQYGAVPPPITLFRNLKRIPNGHELILTPRREDAEHLRYTRAEPADGQNMELRDPETRVQETLDSILAAAPRSSLLYFSGGTDSGLMAACFAGQGRRDIRLLNYSFGPQDTESQLALRIASHLGLECRQIQHDSRQVTHMLHRLARDYSFPFGDFSTVPTNILVHESLSFLEQSSVAIEGTGADGAFGVGTAYPRWRRAFGIPAMLRWPAAAVYPYLRLWKRGSQLERLCYVARKSVRMPLGQAFVASNALDGIAYDIPVTVSRDLEFAVATLLESVGAAKSPEERLSLLDLVWVCAGRMAPKSFDPLRANGVTVIYPFLEPSMICVSSSLAWSEKCAAGEEKALLKKLLAQRLPSDWVYRPKSGFTPPYRELFASAPLQTYLHDIVLSQQNRLLDFCRVPRIRQMVMLARRGRRLSPGVHDFLWALTFASGWLHQLPNCSKEVRQSAVSSCRSLTKR